MLIILIYSNSGYLIDSKVDKSPFARNNGGDSFAIETGNRETSNVLFQELL